MHLHPKRAVPLRYKVENDGRSVAEICGSINASCYGGFSMDTRYGLRPGRIFAAPLANYERLITSLAANPRIDIVTHRDLLAGTVADGRIRAVIRHDVDLDIVTALEMARIEARYGISSSYYILHTAPYYGHFKHGTFLRSVASLHMYKRIQSLGHEIGLHSDPLHIYQNHGIDGAEALKTELAWLRENELAISGTCAHNSVGTYGACNYAIFKGRPRALLMPSDADEVVHEGKWAPLHVLSERALGLNYECNDVFWQPDTPVEYACIMNFEQWARENDKHRQHPDYKNNGRPRPKTWTATTDAFLRELEEIPGGRYLVIVVHPIYYGLRISPRHGPVKSVTAHPHDAKPRLGWRTWRSWSHVATDSIAGTNATQAINYANGWGMLCARMPDDPPTGKSAWLLGGRRTDGSDVSFPAQISALTESHLEAAGTTAWAIVKLAHPDLGVAQQFGWFERAMALAGRQPDIVVIGITSHEAARSLPEHWKIESGWNPSHPPGPYLHLRDDGETVVQPTAADAAIRRRKPNPAVSDSPSLCASDAISQDCQRVLELTGAAIEKIRSAGAEVALLIENCGEVEGLWKADVPPQIRVNAHASMLAALDSMQSKLTMPVAIIDPYRELLPLKTGLPLPPDAWHRAAGRLLAAMLSGKSK